MCHKIIRSMVISVHSIYMGIRKRTYLCEGVKVTSLCKSEHAVVINRVRQLLWCCLINAAYFSCYLFVSLYSFCFSRKWLVIILPLHQCNFDGISLNVLGHKKTKEMLVYVHSVSYIQLLICHWSKRLLWSFSKNLNCTWPSLVQHYKHVQVLKPQTNNSA